MINPLYAFIELLQSRPAIAAAVPNAADGRSRIVFDLTAVEVPPKYVWLVVSGVQPPRATDLRVWRGSMRVTAFAGQPFASQQVVETVVEELWDPDARFKVFHLAGGSQEGAVVSIHDCFNLSRGQMPLSGDIYHPFWAVDFGVQVGEGAASA